MTAARVTEAERLRRCRTLFERAQAIGCTPIEVRQREAEQRWALSDARLAAKRCGTVDDEGGRELAWWQR